jgi:hypothetical protein
MRAKFLKAFRILPWLLLVLVAAYLYFADGWKDLTIGRCDRLANHFFRTDSDHEITEVTIGLLGGTPEQQSHGGPGSRSITLKGQDLIDFLDCWHYQEVNKWGGGFCHDPPYIFHFFQGEKLLITTTLCWHCSNFSFNPGWPFESTFYGFNPDSQQAKKLLAFCDARLPYYRPPPKP